MRPNPAARRRSKDSITVGYCYGSTVHGMFLDCMLKLFAYDMVNGQRIVGNGGGWAFAKGSARVANSRNLIVKSFLAGEADWLLMVDTDMIFRPEDVFTLLTNADKTTAPIVGGLCFGGSTEAKMMPTIYAQAGRPDGKPGFHLETVEDYPRDVMVQVDATGAAFVLIHRQVLVAVHNRYEPETANIWFAESETPDHHMLGEDVTFFLRCRSLGIPVHVHTGVRIGHVKERILDETSFDQYLEQRDSVGQAVLEADFGKKLKLDDGTKAMVV